MSAKKGNRNSVKHGYSHERLYKIWKSMRIRCNCKTSPPYKNYGGRGIAICNEWNDYLNFRNWALTNGYDFDAPKGECTLDRIDTNGNYEPSNCRWVTYTEQANNKSNNRMFEYDGKKMTLAQWGRLLGIKSATLQARIASRGWDIEKALTTPIMR